VKFDLAMLRHVAVSGGADRVRALERDAMHEGGATVAEGALVARCP
jgi:hypothetical protein